MRAILTASCECRELIRLSPRDVDPRVTLTRAGRDGDRDLARALRLFDEELAVNPASGVANHANGVTLPVMMRGKPNAGLGVVATNSALRSQVMIKGGHEFGQAIDVKHVPREA